jgi:hypothetical protein
VEFLLATAVRLIGPLPGSSGFGLNGWNYV